MQPVELPRTAVIGSLHFPRKPGGRAQPRNATGKLPVVIASRPELDKDRVGAYGGSYGGYMTLATVAFYGKRVRAAVDVVGISSLPSFLENTQPYRRDLRRAEYGDERDPAVRAVQERISPLGSVAKIEAELFVQQGKTTRACRSRRRSRS